MVMSETIKIVIITVSILAGLFSIFAVHLMSQKYRLPFLSIYFYFLIFLYIFGIYGVAGARIIRGILVSLESSTASIDYITLVFTYLGIPFLILAMYMFLRLCTEMVKRNLSTGFNLIYFSIQFIIFLAYGITLIMISRFGENRFDLIKRVILITYSSLFAINSFFALALMLFHQRRFIDIKERKAIQTFGLLYLLIITALLVIADLSHLSPWLEGFFLVLLFASHLIPIFFLNINLDKYYIEPVVVIDFNKSVKDFAAKFSISGREKEIIELICKGKSNQDISDCLFISLQTVKDHIHRIYLKTYVKNRVQLANLIRTFQQ
jgi:DNA-binding CsgD family transcriptional regulator